MSFSAPEASPGRSHQNESPPGLRPGGLGGSPATWLAHGARPPHHPTPPPPRIWFELHAGNCASGTALARLWHDGYRGSGMTRNQQIYHPPLRFSLSRSCEKVLPTHPPFKALWSLSSGPCEHPQPSPFPNPRQRHALQRAHFQTTPREQLFMLMLHKFHFLTLVP